MTEFNKLLNSIVRESIPKSEKKVAVLFSGGIDSLTCGFAAQELGLEVIAYTFKIENIPNLDAEVAEDCAKTMGWKFVLNEVPTSNLQEDFIQLSKIWKCKKKTQFECTWPFLYLVPEIKEKYVLSGIAADGHYGLSKKAMIHFKQPKDKFDSFRKDYFINNPNPAGQIQQFDLLSHYEKIQVAPYLDMRIFDFFQKFDWFQINRPKEKQMIIDSYPKLFAKTAIRRHTNLQIVSGVREVFETLLNTELNFNNRSRVMDLCRDYAYKEKDGFFNNSEFDYIL